VRIRPLSIAGSWEIVPEQHRDERGALIEWYRLDHLAEAIGRPFEPQQANLSVSARGVIRGIHYSAEPGQAKYVTCVQGEVLDVIVDLRAGSPTFGQWQGVRLDDRRRNTAYLAEDLGHGFCALTDDATVMYLCSAPYDPSRQRAICPLDTQLAVAWGTSEPRLSERDLAAPSLAEALAAGLLPGSATAPAGR
jgi:dTDP-4-dehydrorhamnose 3,5-epimerase